MYDVSEISLQTTALSALQYLQKRESNVDCCPWPWTSLNFMTQSHTDLGHLDFWRHLDKDVTVIITLLIIIITTSNNRHEQCLLNSISVQRGLAVRDRLSYLERRTGDTHLLWLKPVPRKGCSPDNAGSAIAAPPLRLLCSCKGFEPLAEIISLLPVLSQQLLHCLWPSLPFWLLFAAFPPVVLHIKIPSLFLLTKNVSK